MQNDIAMQMEIKAGEVVRKLVWIFMFIQPFVCFCGAAVELITAHGDFQPVAKYTLLDLESLRSQ